MFVWLLSHWYHIIHAYLCSFHNFGAMSESCKAPLAVSLYLGRYQITIAHSLWSWEHLIFSATYVGVSLQAAAGTKTSVFKGSWMWAPWVILPVNISLNQCLIVIEVTHQLLIFFFFLILDRDFRELTHKHTIIVISSENNTIIPRSAFVIFFFLGSNSYVLAPQRVVGLLPNRDTLAGLLLFVILEHKIFLPGFLQGFLVK